MNPISSIINQCFPKDIKNLIVGDTHEAYQTNMCKTGHNFYSVPGQTFKTWDNTYRMKPDNYIKLRNMDVPIGLDFDLVISQNKFGQFQEMIKLAKHLHLPLLSIEHTLPVPNWDNHTRARVKELRGHLNVFISEFSVSAWGFDLSDPTVRVIHHGIDTDVFCDGNLPRENKILTVANDFINRDWCLNFSQFMRVTKSLPVTIVGNTPGLSKPASSLQALVNYYQTHKIYLNTAHISPIPTSLLEAMACGCAVISCETAAIPHYIKHGYNGLLVKDDREMSDAISQLMHDDKLCKELGNNAVNTIKTKFNVQQFVTNWNNIISECCNIYYGD